MCSHRIGVEFSNVRCGDLLCVVALCSKPVGVRSHDQDDHVGHLQRRPTKEPNGRLSLQRFRWGLHHAPAPSARAVAFDGSAILVNCRSRRTLGLHPRPCCQPSLALRLEAFSLMFAEHVAFVWADTRGASHLLLVPLWLARQSEKGGQPGVDACAGTAVTCLPWLAWQHIDAAQGLAATSYDFRCASVIPLEMPALAPPRRCAAIPAMANTEPCAARQKHCCGKSCKTHKTSKLTSPSLLLQHVDIMSFSVCIYDQQPSSWRRLHAAPSHDAKYYTHWIGLSTTALRGIEHNTSAGPALRVAHRE